MPTSARPRPSRLAPLLVLVLLLGAFASSGPVVAAPAAPAAAKAAKHCIKSGGQSLVVRGRISCRKAERILPAAREYALQTIETGGRTFVIKAFRCTIRQGDPRRFTCRDRDGKPQRSFRWVDRS